MVAAISTAVGPATAQGNDSLGAESLFEQGRQLLQTGHYAEACVKLEASQRLDPGVGTLLNLGDCLEKSGRTASAWERFREAASAAVATGQREREIIARGRVDALASRLCRLRVNVSDAARSVGAAITRDGIALDPAVWGEAVPVDPGLHQIVATAPGKRAWSAPANVDSATCPGTTNKVDVPSLEDEPSARAWPEPPVARSPSSAAQQTGRWGFQRQLALSTGGLGVVAAGVGTYLALDARSIYDAAKSQCTVHGCPDSASNAGTLADFATGAFVLAATAAATGLALWFTAPRHAVMIVPQAAAGPNGSVGLVATGRWP
jgi:hypothetical protein